MNANTEHINIFIAYSRKDETHLKRLRTGLKPLDHRNEDVTIWFDGKIEPGEEWDKTIKTHLRKADIILLLVSMDALASDYFYDDEMQEALARHDNQQAIVIPVILRTCDWEDELGHLQALPKDGKPVTAWAHEDDAYTDIVRGIKRSVKDIRTRRQKAAKIAGLPISIQNLLRNMVYVQGGTFQMGSDDYDYTQPIHTVTLDSFRIGKYPITQAQYQVIMGRNPSYFKGNDQRPVEYVSWHSTQDFIERLNEMTDGNFRLPTEAEWEFAARGGIKSKGFKYAGSNNINEVAWYIENSSNKGKNNHYSGTHPVGLKAPNELGIYDISGNVCEWCQDCWHSYDDEPEQSPIVTDHLLRGGSCYDIMEECQVYNRQFSDNEDNYTGFRIASSIY